MCLTHLSFYERKKDVVERSKEIYRAPRLSSRIETATGRSPKGENGYGEDWIVCLGDRQAGQWYKSGCPAGLAMSFPVYEPKLLQNSESLRVLPKSLGVSSEPQFCGGRFPCTMIFGVRYASCSIKTRGKNSAPPAYGSSTQLFPIQTRQRRNNRRVCGVDGDRRGYPSSIPCLLNAA